MTLKRWISPVPFVLAPSEDIHCADVGDHGKSICAFRFAEPALKKDDEPVHLVTECNENLLARRHPFGEGRLAG